VARGAQLTRFLPLREASPGLEEEELGGGELRGAREGSDSREAVHGSGGRGDSRGADGECGASAKEEGHGTSIGFAGERRRQQRGETGEKGFAWVFTCFGEKWRAQSHKPRLGWVCEYWAACRRLLPWASTISKTYQKKHNGKQEKKAEPAFHVVLSSLLLFLVIFGLI
jgi:hypothetical protein